MIWLLAISETEIIESHRFSFFGVFGDGLPRFDGPVLISDRRILDQRFQRSFPQVESYRLVATINKQLSFRGACNARSAARASYDVQLHIRESITTAGAMDSGPALRPAFAGQGTSRNDERWIRFP
jgi:hypothetical protein